MENNHFSCSTLMMGNLLHLLHQAASFGGANIDPTAWEDKKCKGESRFPAQVNIIHNILMAGLKL